MNKPRDPDTLRPLTPDEEAAAVDNWRRLNPEIRAFWNDILGKPEVAASQQDYPLPLLVAVKQALFRVCEDPELEDARAVLDAIAALTKEPPPAD